MSVTYRSNGGFCDVVAYGPDFAFVYGRSTLTCEVAGKVAWTCTLPEACLFWRIAASPSGAICAAAQGQSGYLVVVVDGKLVDTGSRRTFGVTPTAVQWSIAGQCFEVAYQTGSSTFRVWQVGTSETTTADMPPTSQGFRDWPPGKPLVRSDDAFKTTRNGWTFYEPNMRGDVLVGQTDPPAIRVALPDRVFTAIPGDGFEPHLAVNNGKIAVCARTPKGAALAILSQPWPADERPIVTPPPVTPPPVEPPPVSTDYLTLVRKARDEVAALPPGNERAWKTVNRFCQLAGEDFGLVSKPSGNNYSGYSVDVTMRKDGTAYDILRDGEGAAVPTWNKIEPIDPKRWRAPVGDVVVPPPVEPPPVVTPPPTSIAIEQRLLALELQVAYLLPLVGNADNAIKAHAAALDVLDARFGRLRAKGDTSRVFGHGHPFDVPVVEGK